MKHRSLGSGWVSRGRFAESAVHRVGVGGSHAETSPGGRLPWLPTVARGAAQRSAGPRLATFHRSACGRRLAFGCCLAALVMPSEASAGALFPGPKFAAGDAFFVAVADLDGDTVPDLVTASPARNGDGTFPPVIQVGVGRDHQIETPDPESGHVETEGGPR